MMMDKGCFQILDREIHTDREIREAREIRTARKRNTK